MAAMSVGTLTDILAREVAQHLSSPLHREVSRELVESSDVETRLKILVRILPKIISKDGGSTEDGTGKMLAVAMGVLEKAFIDSIEGNRLVTILKEVILRMDHCLKDFKRKHKNVLDRHEIETEVDRFYKELQAGKRK